MIDRILLAIFVFIPLLACSKTEKLVYRSLVQLISNSAEFDNKLVSTSGWLLLDKVGDGSALFLTKSDLDYYNINNAVLLKLNKTQKKEFNELNKMMVRVKGIYKEEANYGMLSYEEGIQDIKKIEKMNRKKY